MPTTRRDKFSDLVENQQARLSAPYVKRIAKARRDYKAGKGTPLAAVVKFYMIGHRREIYR